MRFLGLVFAPFLHFSFGMQRGGTCPLCMYEKEWRGAQWTLLDKLGVGEGEMGKQATHNKGLLKELCVCRGVQKSYPSN